MPQTVEEIQTNPINYVPRELLASPAFLLAKMGMAMKHRALQEFEQAGYEAYHYGVLALLGEAASSDTQAAIADALAVDRSQLVGILDSLEERGLIERHRDPRDRRRHTVTMTAEGRTQLVRLRGIVRRIEDEFLAPLDAKSRQELHDLLLQLACFHDPRCGVVSA
jgi:MarR family transcriptional regulator, lower aerobic nicotinate degradation pathway regulator